jgi:tRNA pseudouridine13 synthase
MKIKQRPEDFSVIESYRFEPSREGDYFVYRMDKQKLSTLAAVERLRERFHVKRTDVSFCGLKDKQGRTEQLIAVHGRPVEMQEPDLRLTLLGRSAEPLSARNITSNRFSVIVRDLSEAEAARVPESIAEIARVGVVNYFDSQRFGFVKHGQGFIAKDLLRGDLQGALKSLIAHPSELDRTDDAKVKKWFADHWGEWNERPPYPSWVKYRPMIMRLRENPRDFGGALMALDRRLRAMVVFELQSAIWNDAVCRYLRRAVPARDQLVLRYQLGTLVFPRSLPPNLFPDIRLRTFPLLAPDSKFTDEDVKIACENALQREGLTLSGLQVERLRAFHFKHEERPLFIFPGSLRASEPRPDEVNRRRLKVVLSFTLPPGAYATLVVRRVFWFATKEHLTLPTTTRVPRPPKPPSPPPKGFLELQRERKAERAKGREKARPAPTTASRKPQRPS